MPVGSAGFGFLAGVLSTLSPCVLPLLPIVLGAQGASAFAAIARHGVVYKVLAHSHCPVMTLSPAVLAECGVKYNREHPAEVFLAGVF